MTRDVVIVLGVFALLAMLQPVAPIVTVIPPGEPSNLQLKRRR